jgi:tight adherence protein B
LRDQIKALTAEGRLSGIILLILPPLLAGILMVINPEYMSY